MPEPARRIHFVADRGDARLRLDQLLVRRLTGITRLSRTRAQAWIESGAVLVDGAPAIRPAMKVRETAVVEVLLPDSAERRSVPGPEDRSLDVLYEDEHLIAINKPAGLVVHPSYKNTSGTVLNALLHRVKHQAGVRPGIVTRLDKQTSGVMLVALTAGVHAKLQRSPLRKEYLAVVSGTPSPAHGTIDLPLGRDPLDRRRIVADDEGIPSMTRYEVSTVVGDLSLVRCELVTGRTHQIRVHLSACGWPIVGDAVYGVIDDRIARVALHAWRLELPHPVSGKALQIEAPLPPDIATLVGAWHVPGTERPNEHQAPTTDARAE